MAPHFLALPREVRDQIYEYCLLYKGELTPYPTWYDKEDRDGGLDQDMPCVALLRVCRTIRVEAEHVLYSKNVWKVSDVRSMGNPSYDRFIFQHPSIRHMSIQCDSRALDQKYALDIPKLCFRTLPPLAPAERAAKIRPVLEVNLTTLWRHTYTYLEGLRGLKTLRVDFTNSYCPSGCCRIAGKATMCMGSFSKIRERVPKVILVSAEGASRITKVDLTKVDRLPERLVLLPSTRSPPEGQFSMIWHVEATEEIKAQHRVLITATGLISEDELGFIHSVGLHCKHCFIGGKSRDNWGWYCSRLCE